MTVADLSALLHLQDLDTVADQARHRRDRLAERASLRELDQQESGQRAELSEVEAARDRLAAQQQRLEGELAAAERRVAEIDQRLYGGQVHASRDLQALSGETASLRRRASELEDRILAILDEREPLDQQVASVQAALAGVAGQRAQLVESLRVAEAAIDAELAELGSQRTTAAAELPASLLAEYERLRAHLGGVGVARLVGSRCDGCHLSLPATALDQVRHAPVDQVVYCDQCGRILVHVA